MNVKDIEKKSSQATIVVEIDPEQMESGLQKAYQKARKNLVIPGFRKGKAPRKMIEALYGSHVFYEDGLEELFPEIYREAVETQAFRAIGRPSVTNMEIHEDGGVTITVVTDVYPEVTLGAYKGLEVEKAEPAVTEEQVQAKLEEMAQKVASTETVSRAAQMGDTVHIDFEGFRDGVAFDGGSDQDMDLKLGSGDFVPGFEEQLVGMVAGEEKTIDVTFPDDYVEELAGAQVQFRVLVHKVTEIVVPALDDEFAKDVSEFETLEELRADVRAKALAEAQANIDRDFEDACVEKAAENATVELPNTLIEEELTAQIERFGYQMEQVGYSIERAVQAMGGERATLRNMFRPSAERQAKINVMLTKIAEEEQIQISDEEVDAEYAAIAAMHQVEQEHVRNVITREEVVSRLTSRKAVQIIVDHAVAVPPKAEEAEEAAPAEADA